MQLNKNFSFSIQSPVKGERMGVWQHITQMKNVNAELSPFAAMTYPADKAALAAHEVPLHQTLFTSVILLFGFIPVDLHYLAFDKLEPGYGFYENSTTLMHRYWKHTRTITENNGQLFVKDEVHFMPRLPFAGYLLLPLYKTIFKNRHKKLVAAPGNIK